MIYKLISRAIRILSAIAGRYGIITKINIFVNF